MTDEAVRELSRTASRELGARWAVVALGGWGSGALLPGSDLDLLILADGDERGLKAFAESLLYPLWDGGLKVGHQTRTPRQQLRAGREDLKTLTSALTGRAIAGDVEWASAVLADCAVDARRRRRGALGGIRQRPRPGSPYLLEPDLKDGAGGRRDYDELTWTAAVLGGCVRHDPGGLVGLGVLTETEYATLTDAAATVAAARWRLHVDGAGDRLGLESASAMFDEAEAVQRALGETAVVLANARERVSGGRVVRREAPAADLGAAEVMALLGRGEEGLPELELAAQASRLEALAPGYRALMTTRRPGLGHQLTVGAHCLRAAALVTDAGTDHALAASRHSVSDVRPLRVAALAHDAAKAEGGAGHADRGAGPARETALRFGFGDRAAEDVAELVRHHLLLAETALRADLDDEDTILRCAARLGRRELVAPLHLLTAADSRATGPATWTPWTAALVGTLVARIDAALSPDVDGAGLAARGEAVRAGALDAMSSARDAERAFVEAAPLRYLATREPSEVARDAHLVAELSSRAAAEKVLIAVAPGPAAGTHAVTIATPDRPQLLARLAGAMSLAGLDILSVDAYGATGHVALDHFVVASATGRPVTPETFALLERRIEAALRDRLELAARLAERRRHYPARSRTKGSVDVSPSAWDTAVTIVASDRPGLLHDLAAAVSASGLDIRWSRAQTVDGVARDTFHIVGPDGGPVDDTGLLGHLAMRLREAL